MLILLAASSQLNFCLASTEAVFISDKVNCLLLSRAQFSSFHSASFQASVPSVLHLCRRHVLHSSCARDMLLCLAVHRDGIFLFLLPLLFGISIPNQWKLFFTFIEAFSAKSSLIFPRSSPLQTSQNLSLQKWKVCL